MFINWFYINLLDAISVKPVVNKVKNFRLSRDDFETVRIIGRGAFGEVRFIRTYHLYLTKHDFSISRTALLYLKCILSVFFILQSIININAVYNFRWQL